ncbi:MAG: enterotoxin [Acidobacteriaceae bacterium]
MLDCLYRCTSLPILALCIVSTIAPGQTRSATAVNRTMTTHLQSSRGLPEMEVRDTAAGRSVSFPGLFRIALQDGSELASSRLHWDSTFSAAQGTLPGASRICTDLSDPASAAHFRWCLVSHPDRSYMRAELTITAGAHDLPIRDVRLLEFADPEARVIGSVAGSPLADSDFYFGFENPLSWSRVSAGKAAAGITRQLPLRGGQSVSYSAVIGTYTPGQMRRDFLAYIEAERPRAYKPFLNYNTWYDIGYTNRFSEADVLDRIHAFGTELVKKRGVQMDSFVLDDGWDDPGSLWGFDSGFPHGLTRVVPAAAAFHAGIGIWMSPWGGYDQQKVERIAFGKAHGYEIMKEGYALSGPRYFTAFSNVAFRMVDQYHVNLFKFDGTGNADRVFPGSMFDSDFAAAIHLIGELRHREPGLFINLTTGTYPSPFWLLDADSIWRGGDDHSFAGVGTQRQQWITYRDAQTYHNIVQAGPLFPLNSLMLHGMIFAQKAEGLSSDPGNDFPDEVLTYFGSGTQLQEMYVTPSLLNAADWDILARAAQWSRSHASILEDSHWIGGDPGKLEVYGWAAWSPKGWIVTLRNPSNKAQDFSLDLAKGLELPPGARRAFAVRQPFAAAQAGTESWNANNAVYLQLRPFEVRVYESGGD